MYYVDESGSLPTFRSSKWSNRYFVIAFVHTNQPDQLKKVYKHALRNIRKYYPQYFDSNGELKGSQAPPFAKEYIISRLIRSTDISVGYILVDNWNVKDTFREVPARSFNFLVKTVMQNHTLGSQDRAILTMRIDNRNTAIKSLNSLEDYLYQELVLGESITNNVDIQFCDSSNMYNIQVADLIANVIYQYYRYDTYPFPKYNEIQGEIDFPCPAVTEGNYKLLKPRMFFEQEFPFHKSVIGVNLA